MNEKQPTKGVITRRENKAKREAMRAEYEAQKEQDRAVMLDVLRNVLKDPDATTEQRLYAVSVLDNMEGYNFVPYNAGQLRKDSNEIILDFARKMEAYQKEVDK